MGTIGMSEARISYGKKKGRKVPAPRKDAVKDAIPDIQPPAPTKKVRGLKEIVADSEEEDD
jgi:hypothetical protein